ncbi:MAG: 16S rRNA (uracil(1498)-N(3))-methyltransferase [Clostridiales bacterium]|nr:16S rRNA (uracil(1498)-N(3))-methyltransferase [Clostridiales bacterium]
MRRFYCTNEEIIDGLVYFDKNESKHISRVLRLEKGENIIVSTGDGIDRYCTLTKTGEEAVAKIYETLKNENEPESEIVLFQSVIKNEKMDLLIQKVTELGITKIVPVITERTVVKIEDSKKELKKQDRWQKIALEACKQCGRSRVPKVESVKSFDEAIELFKSCQLKIVAYEEETTKSIVSAIPKSKSIGYFIGAEGGITKKEHEKLKQAGAISVSLGKRILRAETAAIVTGGIILALNGEMDV